LLWHAKQLEQHHQRLTLPGLVSFFFFWLLLLTPDTCTF
jgi:hypothetical protein